MMDSDSGPDINRVIAHFDIDCFYCQCEELRDPSLVGKPVAITQKHIVVTCNYAARALGIGKLMNLQKAKNAVPEMILVSGEDITVSTRDCDRLPAMAAPFELTVSVDHLHRLQPYRKASRAILHFLEQWGEAEKGGMDEVSRRAAWTPGRPDYRPSAPSHSLTKSLSHRGTHAHSFRCKPH
jgi:nucleotidyltransferase/DNA polymerase involved in DNA repair